MRNLGKTFCSLSECCVCAAIAVTCSLDVWGAEIEKKSLPVSAWIQRADLYFFEEGAAPKGWLLLCPGRNGDGKQLMQDARWRIFAQRHGLWMCGLSFASSRKDDQLGHYTLVGEGSGDMLLGACDAEAGTPIPFYAVGFSAGARFVTGLVAWKPERVMAWSAQAVANWPSPLEDGRIQPPGIVTSGAHDTNSLFPSLQYFQACRRRKHPTIWLCMENLGHQRSSALDEFTRALFEWKLSGVPEKVYWRDMDSKKRLSSEDVAENPLFASWFPSQKLELMWVILHHP